MNRMPVIFTGHGSPMNAIGDNKARRGWSELVKQISKPKVIIAISAHWTTDSLYIRRSEDNPKIDDMYGFPQELYDLKYEPKGSIEYADRAIELLDDLVEVNNQWGIDHGVWAILNTMYPEADVPVVMLSTNIEGDATYQYEVGKRLKQLRDEGAMILCSGNVVHNLRMVAWGSEEGYPWAIEFDQEVKEAILERDFESVINFKEIANYEKAIPSGEHFCPLLVALGCVNEDDNVTVFNEYCELGSMSMTSYLFK